MSVLKELKPLTPSAFFEVRGKIPRWCRRERLDERSLPRRKVQGGRWSEPLTSTPSQAEKKKQFKKGRLPDVTGLTGEGKLIQLALLWSPVGLYIEMESKLGLEKGDRLELFIDTRDLKTSNVITRFCHHFVFDLEEEQGREETRFRGEDQHELADSSLFAFKTEMKHLSYRVEIALPKEALYGYDPSEFKRLGFCYRFKRRNGEKEHFNLSSEHFNLEKHPALWASMELVE
ncbi:MAG: hypothetical protein KDK64_00655 [Chlamydiia bacterium]|nr:hypothetical protein [Chlamydiia bacterium]